ncbi:aldose epimerase family protein [Thalassotalea piscium]|uniref:Aldose 1-epimerase n=1 Tax=Thalassotalea piscium TaxID=1230533 RepID=A0A7X0NI67_9GAMM|nr:aldose epimerase family protein [Thalassotalea piscium]MBB6543848.1 aldose 1-epimerase [Thalassotalea piscium]
MKSTNLTEGNKITEKPFGHLSSGEAVQLFELTNRSGTKISISNYGAIIVSLSVIDNSGEFDDIVLGYSSAEDYENDTYYLGGVIGRYAGRIKNGKVSINAKEYQLTLNAGNSQLHGGFKGLNKRLWQASKAVTDSSVCLTLNYTSPDGEEGFPGTVNLTVQYTLFDNNALEIEYFANTDQATIINLTQHSYFNLAGHASGNINDHKLTLNASHFLPMNDEVYPTGDLMPVTETVHDFRKSKRIGDDIDSNDAQIIIGKGYDNYWLLNDAASKYIEFSAILEEPNSGRRMTIYTDQPSMIIYTANYIDGSHAGKNNVRYQARSALCLEPVRAVTKEYINDLTPVMLQPDTPFYSKTRYQFDTIKPKA